MKRKFIFGTAIFFITAALWAHTPLLYVDDNKDGTISIECGFSNGASASGLSVLLVEDKPYDGPGKKWEGRRILFVGTLDAVGCLEIVKPKAEKYLVVFDGGPGHVAKMKGPSLKEDEKSEWESSLTKMKTKLKRWEQALRE